MFRPTSNHLAVALAKLRTAVLVCCWAAVLSLLTQLGVWATAMFMDVRYQIVHTAATSALIVGSPEQREISPALVGLGGDVAVVDKPAEPPPAQRQLSATDRRLSMAASLASGVGLLATIAILPLLVLSVLLAVNSNSPGIEQVIAAFTWAVLIALLMLPLGELLGLPWREGALYSYSRMTAEVDAVHAIAQGWAGPTFYARFAGLPLACVVGMTLVGLQYSAGVAAVLPQKEDMRLDPVLEKEAGNISPTSLHGGRSAGALRAATAPVAGAAAGANGAVLHPAGMTQPSAGVAPRRLI
jgi:hypothetical protein